MTTTTGTPLAEPGAEAAASEVSASRTRKRYIVLAMLFLVTTINYADRATLSIARLAGTTSFRSPHREAPSATACTPAESRSSPLSDSSPKIAQRSSASAEHCPLAASRPTASAASMP